jgi:hypothetical protein
VSLKGRDAFRRPMRVDFPAARMMAGITRPSYVRLAGLR